MRHTSLRTDDASSPLIAGNLTDESRPKVLRALENFAGLYPRAGAPARLALSIAQGQSTERENLVLSETDVLPESL
jgi:hypothetical protein